jgi:hypothetical protein
MTEMCERAVVIGQAHTTPWCNTLCMGTVAAVVGSIAAELRLHTAGLSL